MSRTANEAGSAAATRRKGQAPSHGPADGRTRGGGIAFIAVLLLIGARAVAAPAEVAVDYYGEIGCRHCDTFVEKAAPRLEEAYDVTLNVTTLDILNAKVYADCRDRLAGMDRPFRVFPVLFVGNNAYQGTAAVNRGVEEELSYFNEHGEFRPRVPATMDGSQAASPTAAGSGADDTLRLVPLLLAGLADGVNPCAFATMIFLLSLLALVGRSRAQILAVGLVYAFTVFLTYLALGFGLLAVVRTVMNVSFLRTALRIVVSAGTAVFAVLSIRDGVLIRSGRQKEAVLQLSTKAKQRIHGVMRRGVRTGGVIAGTAGLAFLVSLLELACTGQLYFPTIAYLVQTGSTRGVEVLALLAYNLAFILPLVLVFLVVVSGVSSQRIGQWFSRRAAGAKIAMGLVFALLGVSIWIV